MYCQKCGKESRPGAKFCMGCGAPLPGGQAPAPAPYASAGSAPRAPYPSAAPTQRNAAPYGGSTPSGGYSSGGDARGGSAVAQALRAMGSSGAFLTGAVACTAAPLLQILSAAMAGNTINRALRSLEQMLYYSGYDPDDDVIGALLNTSVNMSTGGAIAAGLVAALPAILIAVSVWLMFAAVRDQSGMPFQTTGLTIIKVISILQLVGAVFSLLVIEIVLGWLTAAVADASRSGGSETGVFILTMVLVAVIYALVILYFVKLISTLNAMRDSCRQLAASREVSTYVAVICFISAVCGVFSLIVTLVVGGGAVAALSILCTIVAKFAFGIFLMGYKSRMRMV